MVYIGFYFDINKIYKAKSFIETINKIEKTILKE